MASLFLLLYTLLYAWRLCSAQLQATISDTTPSPIAQIISTTPSTTLPPSSSNSSESSTSISTAIKQNLLTYLIVVLLATFLILALCIGIVFCCTKRRKLRRSSNASEEQPSKHSNISSLIDNYVTSQRVSMHHRDSSHSSNSDSTETRKHRATIINADEVAQRPARSQVNVTVLSTHSDENLALYAQSLQKTAVIQQSMPNAAPSAFPLSLNAMDSQKSYLQQRGMSLASACLSAPAAGSYRSEVGSFAMANGYMFPANGRKSTIKLTHVEHDEADEDREELDKELETEMVTMCDIDDMVLNATPNDTELQNDAGDAVVDEQREVELTTDPDQMLTIGDVDGKYEPSVSSATLNSGDAVMMHIPAGMSDHESEEEAEEMYVDSASVIDDGKHTTQTKQTPMTADTSH